MFKHGGGPMAATRPDIDGRIGLSGVLVHPKRRSIGKHKPDHGKLIDLSLLPYLMGKLAFRFDYCDLLLFTLFSK